MWETIRTSTLSPSFYQRRCLLHRRACPGAISFLRSGGGAMHQLRHSAHACALLSSHTSPPLSLIILSHACFPSAAESLPLRPSSVETCSNAVCFAGQMHTSCMTRFHPLRPAQTLFVSTVVVQNDPSRTSLLPSGTFNHQRVRVPNLHHYPLCTWSGPTSLVEGIPVQMRRNAFIPHLGFHNELLGRAFWWKQYSLDLCP